MSSTWNRDVTVAAGDCTNPTGHHLEVSLSSANPNPSDHPGDTKDNINVNATDRAGGGAKILYHNSTAGLSLTGITPVSGSDLTGLTATPNPPGTLLTLNDTGAAGVTYSYYVTGTYNGASIQTCDPQIHNT